MMLGELGIRLNVSIPERQVRALLITAEAAGIHGLSAARNRQAEANGGGSKMDITRIQETSLGSRASRNY